MRELSIEELNLVSGGDGGAAAPPDPTLGGALQSNPAALNPIINSMLTPQTSIYVGDWYKDEGLWCTTYNGGTPNEEQFCLPPGTNLLQAGDIPE
jgi:hypothetical protein